MSEAPKRRGGWLGWLIVILIVAAGAWWLFGRETKQQARPPQSATPVTVAAAAKQDVPLTVDALGTVAATNSITVRSQVTGTLTQILFTEGQEVKAGDVLARIDDRSYRAALDSAIAKQAYDEAQLENARVDLRRYQTLVRSQGVTQQSVDTQRAQVAMYEAQVRQDIASVDSARVDLDHTTIRSPIDGRVGIRAVDAGNLVSSTDTDGIVTISQLRPIVVTFSLPQQDLPRVKAAQAAGPVPVRTVPDAGATDQTVREGRISTIDNSIDSTTGTIKVKSSFPNDDAALWPGAFINVRVQLEIRRNVLTVPIVAIQRGPDGAFVFVVKQDNTIEKRVVKISVQTAELAVIGEGLNEGERVVTSGALRLTPGSKVSVSGQ
ncbi:efflux RND transporter periplasmic adaptor subunit [Acetobacteraceae bacterium H6797]|nr:efflux RND transporter periplasmic adaptor subunit [Acetobacteraceae bacterium H6797]